MTYENCLKYAKEARDKGDEETALFWEKRAETKKKLNHIVEEDKKEEPKEEVKEVKRGRPKKE